MEAETTRASASFSAGVRIRYIFISGSEPIQRISGGRRYNEESDNV